MTTQNDPQADHGPEVAYDAENDLVLHENDADWHAAQADLVDLVALRAKLYAPDEAPLRFTLTLTLGEGMQTGENVATALRRVADNVGRVPAHWPFDAATASVRDRFVRDDNGNSVGSWEVR